jgi:TrmH family RNA methyltransferase
MRVSSRDNPRVKAIRRLADHAAQRKAAGQTILEGEHLCSVYLDTIGAPLSCVVAASALLRAEVRAIVDRVPHRAVLEIDDQHYASLSSLESSVAVLFQIEIPKPLVDDDMRAAGVLLDRLQDPGNLGSILRSSAAAGVRSVLLSEGCVSAWSPKVLRSAMGAHFSLAIFESVDLRQWIERAPMKVLATSSHATNSIYQTDLLTPCAWLFGNEGQGVDRALLERATAVSIPQPGGEESLNVAAAAAVCLFEAVRQRLGAGL